MSQHPLLRKNDDDNVEDVEIDKLYSIQRGNRLGKTDVDALSADMKQNGYRRDKPVDIMYYQESRTAHIGEGNHRTEAAKRAGVTHVPARVHRYKGSGPGSPVRGKDPDEYGYTPASMKPSDIL